MNHPLVYEINTRCWLQELSEERGVPVTLSTVPEEQFRAWQDLGFTHVWLMGIWPTGPQSRSHALDSPFLRDSLSRILPEWHPKDIAGSPFAVSDYKVARALGGEQGLQRFREKLHLCGIKLLLDFVPNHVGLDHSWVRQHPEYFVQSDQPVPGTFEQETPKGPRWIAHGKDPNFPPWIDTAQLDYRKLETQRAVADAFQAVARRCDGLRCDMAMLLLRDVFTANWKAFPLQDAAPEGEFWSNLIRKVRRSQPDILLLAEVYWDLEARLQSLGFDYTYDKRLYDYLVYQNRGEVRRHLFSVTPDYLRASAHFLENHDEPRIASILTSGPHKAAALLLLGLPGLRLLHEGQLSGCRHHLPVQLARRPREPVDQDLVAFYDLLLHALRATAVGAGRPELLPARPAWPGNPSHQDLVAVQWQAAGEDFDLVVVNLASQRSQAYVAPTVRQLNRRNWSMKDLLGPEEYQRYGDDLQTQGLYLDLPPHAAQLFHFQPIA